MFRIRRAGLASCSINGGNRRDPVSKLGLVSRSFDSSGGGPLRSADAAVGKKSWTRRSVCRAVPRLGRGELADDALASSAAGELWISAQFGAARSTRSPTARYGGGDVEHPHAFVLPSGTAASYFELRQHQRRPATFLTCGAAVRWVTNPENVAQAPAHFRNEVDFARQHPAFAHQRLGANEILERAQVGVGLARQMHGGKYGDVETELSRIEQPAIALDVAGLLQGAGPAAGTAAGEMPTRLANSTLVIRPSAWISLRILRSISSRFFDTRSGFQG